MPHEGNIRASLNKLSDDSVICTLEGSKKVYIFDVLNVSPSSTRLKTKLRGDLPQIRFSTISTWQSGNKDIDILIASHFDNKLRAYLIDEDAIMKIFEIKLDAEFIFWISSNNCLLFEEKMLNKQIKEVSLLRLSFDPNSKKCNYAYSGRAVPFGQILEVESMCKSNKGPNKLLIFNKNKGLSEVVVSSVEPDFLASGINRMKL